MELLNNRNIIIGLVIIVLGVVGFIIYKKYFAKDRNVIRLPGSIGGNKKSVEDSGGGESQGLLNNTDGSGDGSGDANEVQYVTGSSGNDPYFVIQVGGETVGKIVFELIDDVVPKTCKNFRQLCSKGVNGMGAPAYKGSTFHRIIEDFMIQGGDFTNHNGTGGYSIYGDKFEDESFELKHNQPGILSMANAGPNTNGSQFFICTQPAPHLDGKHVAFGIVKDGYDVIEMLNGLETDGNDKPLKECKIVECGLC